MTKAGSAKATGAGLPSMAGAEYKNYAIVALPVLVSFLLWLFFFNASGNIIGDFLNLKISALIGTLFSMNFILFAILFPLTYALVVVFCMKFSKIEVMGGSVAGLVVGAGLGAVLFPAMLAYIVIFIFYVFSILLAAEGSFARLEEIKKWKHLRVLNQGVAQGVSILAIGIFVFGIITIFPVNNEYVKNMEENMIGDAFDNVAGGMGMEDKIADSTAEVYLAGQMSVLDSLIASEQYVVSEDVMLKGAIAGTKEQVGSDEYQAQVKQQYREANMSQLQDVKKDVDVLGMMKEQFPFIVLLEQFTWLLLSMTLASMVTFLGTVVFRPLGIIYGLILAMIIARE